ncbi:hypothetical protein ACIQLG_13910 [Terribacillus saccharophilus]|uniref:hypothetical protein n=1 Tax=Terribacillus saccharophilus TaxID=361277 RepID=UPI003817D67B
MKFKYGLNIIKELYLFELESKDRINNKVTVPIGIIVLLVGALVFFSKDLKNIEMNGTGIIFFIFYAAYIITILVTIIFVVLSYYNYKYRTLPTEKSLDAEITRVIDYYEANYVAHFSKYQKENLIQDNVDKRMYNHYLKATEKNRILNAKKNRYLRLSGYSIVISLGILCGLFIFYQLSFNEDPIKIHISNIKEVKINHE